MPHRTRDHVEDEDLSFLDEFDEQVMSEADVIGLKHETLLSDLREIETDLIKKQDRLRYYDEVFSLEDMEILLKRVNKLLRDYT